MKNLLFILSLVISFSINATAETVSTAAVCHWNSFFKYPQNNATFNSGKDVYVRVDAQKHYDIAFMELYVNGMYVRKESNYPYEWCKGSGNSDYHLRNLKAGTYKLKTRIKDKCGKYHEIYCTFHVKGNGHSPPNGHHPPHNTNCHYKAWYKYPQNGKYYNTGSDVYVKLDAQNYHNIKYTELFVNGQFIRKETTYPYEWCKGSGNSDGHLRNMKAGTYKLKARVYDKCGKYKDYYSTFYVKNNGHHPPSGNPPHNGHCNYKAWFKYPQNGKYYDAGKDVYVRLDAQDYHKIKYTELYVNGKFVRKETSYPYEWCKGSGNSDGYLRKLKAGTYKLKARVYDTCGKYKDYYTTFYVKGSSHHPPVGSHCKYKSWFKYPKNNGTYQYGKDVYVRVDTEKYQDIEHMELYVNNQYVRKESTYPYEWCKGSGNSDSHLRNLKRGTYNLKCRVKTRCGKYYEYYTKFYVR